MTTRSPIKDIPPEQQLAGLEDLKRKRVLLVDCHSAVRAYLRSQLSLLGVKQVHAAISAADVMRLARQNEYDIILCDYVLDDGRDGQQLLEELRKERLIPLTTIFMIVTGENAYRNVVAVAELGPDEYLVKPFTAEQLHARLLRALFKRRAFADVYRCIERDDPEQALAACDRILATLEVFYFDAMRMKGEILNAKHRHAEAEEIYRAVLDRKVVPWARMGLAFAAHRQGRSEEARFLAEAVIEDFPEFLGAYDFLGNVLESQGDTRRAQGVLQDAARISPHNTDRQRAIGNMASRNGDLVAANSAYGAVIARGAQFGLATPQDYASAARTRLMMSDPSGASDIAEKLRRDCRGEPNAELAALVVESLCARQRGDDAAAGELLQKALALHDDLSISGGAEGGIPHAIAVDLAHACLQAGRNEVGESLLRKAAAENPEHAGIVHQIRGVYDSIGRADEGHRLIAEVSEELVRVNNEGVMRARRGDLEGAVELLSRAAEATPNVQFLVNAAKAIFALLDRRGWNESMARDAMRYLQLAEDKDPGSERLASARAIVRAVAGKYGIKPQSLTA